MTPRKVLLDPEETKERQLNARIEHQQKIDAKRASEQEALMRDVDRLRGGSSGVHDETELEFKYRGFRCSAVRPEHLLWRIETLDGSTLPDDLQGKFTGRHVCRDAIDSWLTKHAFVCRD